MEIAIKRLMGRNVKDRVFVWLVATLLGCTGLAYLFAPAEMASPAGLSADAGGLTDIRATYGGFQVGIAVFLVWLSRSQLSAALLLTAVVFGAVLISRVTGLLIDASLTGFHQTALGFEVTIVALAVWFYSRP